MSRRANREKVFQLLFSADYYRPEEMTEQIRHFFESEEAAYFEKKRLEAEAKEIDPNSLDLILPASMLRSREEVRERVLQILPEISELDGQLNEKIDGWDTTRIGRVELTVLRLALYEMQYDESISEAVAINEAVELAKKFGQEKSAEFINGVLAKFTEKNQNGSSDKTE
ncbi:MAG: transcription antitermination factor NusB [Lachnospiraceae bacterium]|nr:transcription antitermination factor NusB [Lachnospiraceae bacterium]